MKAKTTNFLKSCKTKAIYLAQMHSCPIKSFGELKCLKLTWGQHNCIGGNSNIILPCTVRNCF